MLYMKAWIYLLLLLNLVMSGLGVGANTADWKAYTTIGSNILILILLQFVYVIRV